jgi:hypothetical protein
MGWWKRGLGVSVAAMIVAVSCGGGGGSGGLETGGSRVVDVAIGDLEVMVTDGGFEPVGMVADVVTDPAGCVVAVGLWDASRGGMEAGHWSSTDCVRFTGPGPSTAEPQGDALPSDDKTLLTGVALRPQGDFVAVGYTEERADDIASEMNVFVLGVVDGPRRVAAPPPAADRAHQAAEDVIVTQAGTVLVVGVDEPIGGVGASVWRSTDLATAAVPAEDWTEVPATWERVPLPAASPDVVFTEPTEILQRGDGTLVVVGSSNTEPIVTESDPAVWVSHDDGRSWGPADPVGDLASDGPMRRIDAVAEVAGGAVVGVGRHGDGGCVWRSDDGSTWSEAPVERMCGEGWTADVAAGDRGVVVVGSTGRIGPPDRDGDRRGSMWYSADATTWTRVELAPGVAYAAIPTATGFLVLGGTEGYVTWTAQVTVADASSS